jgi:hypothetical protein
MIECAAGFLSEVVCTHENCTAVKLKSQVPSPQMVAHALALHRSWQLPCTRPVPSSRCTLHLIALESNSEHAVMNGCVAGCVTVLFLSLPCKEDLA